MSMIIEVRRGGIEKQFTSYNKFFADNERASQLTYTELNEIKGQIAELRQQLDDTKRAINVLEVAVNDLKLRTNPRNLRRSEEHTSELQSLMRISYAVFCLKQKKKENNKDAHTKTI